MLVETIQRCVEDEEYDGKTMGVIALQGRAQADLIARGVQISSQQPADTGDWSVLGEQVYGNNCAACHATSGEGLTGVFPPLKGNAVVGAADPSSRPLALPAD